MKTSTAQSVAELDRALLHDLLCPHGGLSCRRAGDPQHQRDVIDAHRELHCGPIPELAMLREADDLFVGNPE